MTYRGRFRFIHDKSVVEQRTLREYDKTYVSGTTPRAYLTETLNVRYYL